MNPTQGKDHGIRTDQSSGTEANAHILPVKMTIVIEGKDGDCVVDLLERLTSIVHPDIRRTIRTLTKDLPQPDI